LYASLKKIYWYLRFTGVTIAKASVIILFVFI
jgi:hypothetical protein